MLRTKYFDAIFRQIRCLSLPFTIHGSTIDCHADHGVEVTGDVSPPLHPSTTFLSGAPESYGQLYSRIDNVTRQRVEALIGSLEGGQAVSYASGLSAATALIQYIKPRRIYMDAGYFGIRDVFHLWAKRHSSSQNEQVEFYTLEQCKQLSNKERSLDLIWLESPNNPYATISDLEWFADLANRTGACLAVDSTLSSPLGQRPFDHGAHIVMHSSTKYLSGHSDLLGGVLIVHPTLTNITADKLRAERTIDGAVMGNLEAWLLLRSIRTYSLRIQRQTQTALTIVDWLEHQRVKRNKITKVHHPSLKSHPSYSLAARYLRLPPATFSFEFESQSQARSFARSLVLCKQATSLGGVETLIDWRYAFDTTVSPALLRISVGIEEANDLIQDFEQALTKAN